jgi:hypothetical protein
MPARKYLCSLLAVALLAQAVPVLAHDDGDDDEDHDHHGYHRYYEHERRYEEQRFYYEPVVVAPAPAYVYEAPTPAVVYPSALPPVVYQYKDGADVLAPFFFGAIVGGVLGAAASRH